VERVVSDMANAPTVRAVEAAEDSAAPAAVAAGALPSIDLAGVARGR
jgi:hypothetical protein